MKTTRRTFVQQSESLLAPPSLLGASGEISAPASAPTTCVAPDLRGEPLPELLQPLPDAPGKKSGNADKAGKAATAYAIDRDHIYSKNTQMIIPQANQFAGVRDEMALAIREGRAPKTLGKEGLRDVKIMEAIYRAAKTSQQVKV